MADNVRYQSAQGHTLVAFDLDDTLYPEMQFVHSGFMAVAQVIAADCHQDIFPVYRELLGMRRLGLNAFDYAAAKYYSFFTEIEYTVRRFVYNYRFHLPSILLYRDMRTALELLHRYGVPMAIVTEGRTLTQNQKIDALGLREFIPEENIFISEKEGMDKSSPVIWRELMYRHPECSAYAYVGDNPAKDFEMPKKLGWATVGIRDTLGCNIHPQTGGTEPKRWETRQSFVELLRRRIAKRYNRLLSH